MTRAERLARIIPCLQAVSPREGRVQQPLAEDTCLISDLWLNGHGIVRLGELLEEEFGTVLPPSALVGLALNGATLGALLDLLEAPTHA